MYNQNNNKNNVIKPVEKIAQNLIPNYLKKHIGRKILIEYDTQNNIKEIYGQLISVGDDYIVIKLPTEKLSTALFKNNYIKKIIMQFD